MDTGLTFEEQRVQGIAQIKKLGIPLRELNPKELGMEIENFLKKL